MMKAGEAGAEPGRIHGGSAQVTAMRIDRRRTRNARLLGFQLVRAMRLTPERRRLADDPDDEVGAGGRLPGDIWRPATAHQQVRPFEKPDHR